MIRAQRIAVKMKRKHAFEHASEEEGNTKAKQRTTGEYSGESKF